MDWMLMPIRRYAEFSGRSRRKEYWMFTLFNVIVSIVISIIEGALGLTGAIGGFTGPLSLVFSLALLVPGIAVLIRRLHDQDKSGWFALLLFIPILGAIILLVFLCLPGTAGQNRFGADPKNPGNADVFS